MFNNVDKIVEALDEAITCGNYSDGVLPGDLEILKKLEEQLPKFVKNYEIMLKYIKDKSIPDTFCGLHEAIQNEREAKEAKKILEQIGEV